MARVRPGGRRPIQRRAFRRLRDTVDASVFVNAFNPHEEGHADSLAMLATIQEAGDPIIGPTLLLTEIASAVARASDDSAGALQYANAAAALPQLTLVSLTSTMARPAAGLGPTHRLSGGGAACLARPPRGGTTLASRGVGQCVGGDRFGAW